MPGRNSDAVHHAASFSWDATVEALLDVYCAAVRDHRRQLAELLELVALTDDALSDGALSHGALSDGALAGADPMVGVR